MNIIQDSVREEVREDLNEYVKLEIKRLLEIRKMHEKVILSLDVGAHVMLYVTTILSFIGTIIPAAALVAGIFGVIASGSLTFSHYLVKQNKNKTDELTQYLKIVDIHIELPIEIDIERRLKSIRDREKIQQNIEDKHRQYIDITPTNTPMNVALNTVLNSNV
jgi:hypothetical protein